MNNNRLNFFLFAFAVTLSASVRGQELVTFDNVWSSPFTTDPVYSHHFVNGQGKHLYLLNKTAWAYFASRSPEQVLRKAKEQGVNVLRVALEGAPYQDVLHMEMWPWGGSRQQPRWNTFNEKYWSRVEQCIRLAGENGIGFDIVIYFTYHPTREDLKQQHAYWREVLRRLGKYSNILVWEMANEYTANESFQDEAGAFFKANDPYKRAVCSSDGTTEDALWPYKPWMDLALVHTCTGNQEPYDLEYWYLNIARNVRQYGKPAFNNETGREVRHKNDDAVYRRKQAWLWTASGAYWTWHSWEGCEGIDDSLYYGPGWQYLKPMADYYRSIPFWKMEPNYTVATVRANDVVFTALAAPDRQISLLYCCARESGKKLTSLKTTGRLRDGVYEVRFYNPATMEMTGKTQLESAGLRTEYELALPPFTDDLLVEIRLIQKQTKSLIEGTN